jgi:hypothetical protein
MYKESKLEFYSNSSEKMRKGINHKYSIEANGACT